MILGVDIAGSYQGSISISKLKTEGYAFVVCKATEGTSYSAPLFDTWVNQIKANGMTPGAYHFIRAGDGAAQARFFYSKLTPHGGPDGFIIQLDCEADASYQTVVDFVHTWNALSGNYPFAFYTGDWWLQPKGWNIAALTPYLWAAPNRGYTGGYTGDGSTDWHAGYGGYSDLSIEQFTSKGTAGGITANVDIDAIRDPNLLNLLTKRSDDLSLASDPDGIWLYNRVQAMAWLNQPSSGPEKDKDLPFVVAFKDLQAKVNTLAAQGQVSPPTQEQVDSAVLKALSNPNVIAALGAAVASHFKVA